MPKTAPFDNYTEQYEAWFEKNRWVYAAELQALEAMVPVPACGLEIGVGTARFARPLGIKIGVEPSDAMGRIAQERGIQAVNAVAEELPFADGSFDCVLMVTTVCFLDDINRSLIEAYRVLSRNGLLAIGFVDRNSKLGKSYLNHQKENVFYRDATFFSVGEVCDCLKDAGFSDLVFGQTLFGALSETGEDEPIRSGYGKGAFVVIGSRKRGRSVFFRRQHDQTAVH